MPSYDFECDCCGYRETKFDKMLSPRVSNCPSCKRDKLIRLIGCGEISIGQKYKDKYGTPIWFPKDNKPYYDRSLRKKFNTPEEKRDYLKDNNLVMHPSDNPKGKWPVEGGDTRDKSFRKATKMED